MIHFDPTGTPDEREVAAEIAFVSRSPLVSGLLHSVSGSLAVLNEHRQVVAFNDSFLKTMGVEEPMEALGLRLGEALHCIHAQDEPAGCGTAEFCSSCGGAIAIAAGLAQDTPVERKCALTVVRGDREIDIALLVRSYPLPIHRKKYLLLFLQDITQQERRAALERTFFHDVNNLLAMLLGASHLLLENHPSKLAETIHRASWRLHREIAIQRSLSQEEDYTYQITRHEISLEHIFSELQSFFAIHPAARGKIIEFQDTPPGVAIQTDISLVFRILSNMTLNALEATEQNGMIKVWAAAEEASVTFCVWNSKQIPEETAARIFQRNFSTKDQDGRGLGTFSMKFFGEQLLGGKVTFMTSAKEGTVFRFSLPLG